LGWGKCDGEKRWQPHNARGQMITERTTCSHDFIYTVTTLFTQLRLYLLATFAEPGFDPEITLDQVLPRMPFGIHIMMDAEPFIVTSPKRWRRVEVKDGAPSTGKQQLARRFRGLGRNMKWRPVETGSKMWRAVEKLSRGPSNHFHNAPTSCNHLGALRSTITNSIPN
jgi:hypothetical protein